MPPLIAPGNLANHFVAAVYRPRNPSRGRGRGRAYLSENSFLWGATKTSRDTAVEQQANRASGFLYDKCDRMGIMTLEVKLIFYSPNLQGIDQAT
jgi:hypothetical protein